MKTIIVSKSRLLSGVAFLFAIFSISNSCTKTMSDEKPGLPYSPSQGNEVSVYGGAFDPPEISVDAGTIITWTNKGQGPQSVTSDEGLFEGVISINGTYSYRFSTPGTYQYFNRMNPNVSGKVVVNE